MAQRLDHSRLARARDPAQQRLRRWFHVSWSSARAAMLAIAVGLGAGHAVGAAVSDCADAQGSPPERSNARRIKSVVERQPQYLLTLVTQARGATVTSYAKGEVVLEGLVALLETQPALVPSQSFRLGSWWLFSPSVSFEAGRPIVLEQQALLRDGTVFDVVTGSSRSIIDRFLGGELSYFLIDAKGTFCDRLFIRHPSGTYVYLPGVLRTTASDVQFERRMFDDDFGRWGLRIVFNGRSNGELRFQEEVWSLQGNFAKSVERRFNADAKSVEISRIPIDVSEVGDADVKLKIDIPERLAIARSKAYALREFVAGGATVEPRAAR